MLADNGVELARALEATSRLDRVAAHLELHIEQGPVLDAEGQRAAAVRGCAGVERHRFWIEGQASHAGTTPMDRRRDAGLAAADAACGSSDSRRGEAAWGRPACSSSSPGSRPRLPASASLGVDLQPRRRGAREMLGAASAAVADAAAPARVRVVVEPVWRIEPIAFDPDLVELAREACREVTGSDGMLASGALHDAAEIARVRPAAMVFTPSIGGISHAREEDTSEEDLAAGIEAFSLLANRAAARRSAADHELGAVHGDRLGGVVPGRGLGGHALGLEAPVSDQLQDRRPSPAARARGRCGSESPSCTSRAAAPASSR